MHYQSLNLLLIKLQNSDSVARGPLMVKLSSWCSHYLFHFRSYHRQCEQSSQLGIHTAAITHQLEPFENSATI
jgi:hypothetical protein